MRHTADRLVVVAGVQRTVVMPTAAAAPVAGVPDIAAVVADTDPVAAEMVPRVAADAPVMAVLRMLVVHLPVPAVLLVVDLSFSNLLLNFLSTD